MKTVWFLFLLAYPLSASSSPEARLVTGPEFKEARQPQIAISDSGTLHITFGIGTAIYATRSEDAGASFSDPTKVGELEKLALGMRRGPRIATVGQEVIISAISHADGELYSWRSGDRGQSWLKPVKINDAPKAAAEGLHDLASDGQMKVAAAWLDLRNGKTELWASVSTDAGKTWVADTLVYRSPDESICECCHPSVAFTPAGEIVVMWRNWLDGSRDMYRARSSDGGKSFSAATRLGTSTWKLQACPMDGGSLGIWLGRIAYAWRSEGHIFTTTDPGSETLLSSSGAQPVVVWTPGGVAYIWQDQGNLYWKASPDSKLALLASSASFAATARNASAKIGTVVFEGHDGVYLQLFR